MIELPLIFVAGVLGSAHCVGMCGPFAIAIGSAAPSWRSQVARQAAFTAGRIFTYTIMGAIAGYAGWELGRHTPLLRNGAAALALLAGLFLLYQGLLATGVLRRRKLSSSALPCLGHGFLASFLRSPSWTGVFLAGLFTGMIPCGLVYGFVALAASSGGLATGALLMAVFGLGTAPVLMLTGGGTALLSPWGRRRLYQAAAWCVILTGAIAIARGAGFITVPGWHEPAGCPACVSR